ncbi:glycosyl hydrolase family 18 protein [Paenibacillus xanthanilyticus]|uniref:Glycosyl hydrolase family 18 protein n=1 Tax=Paenibacillus xanthanilyticus TaxID=1783531 RepID=A0ABV8K4K8_9BACL
MQTVQVRPRRRKPGGLIRTLLRLSFFFLLGVVLFGVYWLFIPNTKMEKPQYGYTHPIMVAGTIASGGAVIEGTMVKLPLKVLMESAGLANAIWYEEATGSIVLTSAHQVLRLKTDLLTATLNSKPYELREAAEVIDGEVYLPSTPLTELYGLHVEADDGTGAVTLIPAGKSVQRAKTTTDTALRSSPTIRATIYEKLQAGAEVRIWEETTNPDWYKVQALSGTIGYMPKDKLSLIGIEQVKQPLVESPFVAWKVMGSKINMTWEGVYAKKTDVSAIGALDGVNVVSPTWFELIDGTGKIRSKADKAYVDWAAKRKTQVWALFSNGFEPKRTTQALATAQTRFNMIQQLVAYAQIYRLQGINIDFENVETADKANLVQFVRELTPILHEQGLVVSIDVTPKSNSEMWSAFLDRPALAESVDFMMLMAYDEHWASSPKAGSVASLPWTENSILRLLQEDGVPPSKLVLGMPLYARVWTETKQADGTNEVSSKALGMQAIDKLIAERKLKPVFDAKTGQNYVEYTEGGAKKRIWIEDDISIRSRIVLVKKYGLAGVATWQRSFQDDQIWGVIDQALQQKP